MKDSKGLNNKKEVEYYMSGISMKNFFGTLAGAALANAIALSPPIINYIASITSINFAVNTFPFLSLIIGGLIGYYATRNIR